MINRCIPAVFNEILDMKQEMKTSENYTMKTVFGEKITGSQLENGTKYGLCVCVCVCVCFGGVGGMCTCLYAFILENGRQVQH